MTAGGGSTKTANLPFTASNALTINGGTILDLGTTVKTVNLQGSVSIAGSLSFGSVTAKTVNVAGDLSGTGTITMSGAGLAHNLNLGGVNNAISVFILLPLQGVLSITTKSATSRFRNNNYQNLTIPVPEPKHCRAIPLLII